MSFLSILSTYVSQTDYHLFYFPGGLDTQNFKMALNLDEELYDVNARLREIEEMCSDSDDDEANNEPR